MNKIIGVLVGALLLSYAIGGGIEYSRPIPGNLPVFVVNNPTEEIPKEYYSSPHAYSLFKKNVPLAQMTLSRAYELNIPIAKDSKNDFECSHNFITWHMIDAELWPNYCRWNKNGEWQNSQWPRWLEVILRIFYWGRG